MKNYYYLYIKDDFLNKIIDKEKITNQKKIKNKQIQKKRKYMIKIH